VHFLGNTNAADLTGEHIFGKALARWFRERYGLDINWTVGNDFLGPLVKKGSGPIMNIQPPLACGNCNSGPLANEMEKSLEPLKRLIEGQSPGISPKDRDALSRYWERVGLIVDVMTSNYQITEEYKAGREYQLSKEHRQAPPLYSDAQRKVWLQGGKVSDMKIYIGFHHGVLGLNPYIGFAPRLAEPATQGPTAIEKRFLLVIGKLAVCVWMGEPSLDVAPSWCDLASADQDWPRTVAVSYQTFFGLFNRTADVEVLIRLTADPELCRRIEECSKQARSFVGPPDIHMLGLVWSQLFKDRGAAVAHWTVDEVRADFIRKLAASVVRSAGMK